MGKFNNGSPKGVVFNGRNFSLCGGFDFGSGFRRNIDSVVGAPFVKGFIFNKFAAAVFSGNFAGKGHCEFIFLKETESAFFRFRRFRLFNFNVLFGFRNVFGSKKRFFRVIFFFGNNAVFRNGNAFFFVKGTYGSACGNPGGADCAKKTNRHCGVKSAAGKKRAEAAFFIVFHFMTTFFKKILWHYFCRRKFFYSERILKKLGFKKSLFFI